MKFRIYSTDIYDHPEHLLDEYPCLNDYEFEIERTKRPLMKYIRDEEGKSIEFDDGKSYTFDEKAYVEIGDLETLIKLMNEVDEPIIIFSKAMDIEIYDGYRE